MLIIIIILYISSSSSFIGCEIVEKKISNKNNNDQWILVDDFNFNNFINNVDNPKKFWYYNQDWLVDDEPENLCMGMNIYQYSCHRKENVRVNKKGHLEIVANINEHIRKTGYSRERFLFDSGMISSKKSWLYGRFVLKAILPEGRSLRSVFILRPVEPKYSGDWLNNGQINGLVYAQQQSAIIAGIHYKMPAGQSYMGRKLYTQRNITRSFNNYVVEWSEHSIRWMFNDFVFFEHNVTKPFDQQFNLILQLGVGGPEFSDQRSGAIQQNDSKQWYNNRFIIDSIRVYQRSSRIPYYSRQSSRSSSLSLQMSSNKISMTIIIIISIIIYNL
uniref:Beta-1,3 glucanase n=1 Tax=Dermatophagoides pteronyssinus TaxID=6956 RepID=A0A5J6DE05_DERPT|nr:beta-1,3 glucanase [Dermatophagoides pteronyssinus]